MSRFFRFSPFLVIFGFALWQTFPGLAQQKPAPTDRPELALQLGHSLSVFSLAYSPDGSTLASGGGDGTIKIWDAREQALIRTIAAHSANVRAVAYSPDGKNLASASEDGTVKFWNVANGRLQLTIGARPAIENATRRARAQALAYSPDGSTLAVGYADGSGSRFKGELVVFDARSGQARRVLSREVAAITALAFSPDGKTLATGGNEKTIRFWNPQTGDLIRTLTGHDVNALAFSPDGSTLGSAGWDKTVRLWKVGDGSLLRTLNGHTDAVRSLAFSPDGSTLASNGSTDKRILLWNARSGAAKPAITGLKSFAWSLAFSPDGSTLAAGSSQAISLWNVRNSVSQGNFEERPRWTKAVAYSPDGKKLAAAGGEDRRVYLWDAQSGRLSKVLEGAKARVLSLAFSPDGKWIAGAGNKRAQDGNAEILLWNAQSGAVARRLAGHRDAIQSLAFSPDGQTLASGSSDAKGFEKRGEISLWNFQSGARLRTLSGQPGWVQSLAFSPDGKLLVAANSGQQNKGAVEVWDPQNGALLRALGGYRGWVSSVAFSRDGSTVAGAGRDGLIRLWNARTGRFLKAPAHGAWVRGLAFSPDGSTLASGGKDNLIRVWNSADGKLLHTLRGHEFGVETLAFSPRGSTLASGSADTTVRIWSARQGRQLAALLTAPPERAERQFTAEPLWLAATPEGYYDCAEGADYLVKWRFNQKLLPFYHFEEAYRRPETLRRALAGERIAARPLLLARVPPSIRIISPLRGATISGKSVRVLVEAADDGQLNDFKLYVNGVLVPETVAKPIVVDGKPIVVDGKPIVVDGKTVLIDGKPIVVDGKPIVVDGKEVSVEAQPNDAAGSSLEDDSQEYAVRRLFVMDIPLPASNGELVLRAVVTDDEQNKSDAAVAVKSVTRAPVTGDLYLLCAGVSQYRNPNYNIGFAADDAHAIAGVLQAQKSKSYARVHTTILTDKQATVQTIRAALAKLKSAKPNDTVMVFLSGHGLRTGGKYYFAPWGTFVNDIAGTCLEWNEILNSLGEVYASKLLFTDACFSGAKLGALQATSGELAELARQRSGIVVISSSQADEFSFEDKDAKQGAFTVALLEAFAGRGDMDGDGNITLPELAMYVPRRVSTLTKGLQNPQLVLVQDFNPQMVLAKFD